MTSDAMSGSPPGPAPAPAQKAPGDESGWTAAVRNRVEQTLPLTELLPTKQPAYIGSWVYSFGVICIAALVWVVVSGVVLAFFGSAWWHISAVGHFFNSVHFWSVQMFFIFLVLHLWGQYWGAGWRDGRATTWMVGVVIFLVSVVTAFTGYLIQQNFDSQWIAINAKDGINSTGIGRPVQRAQLRPAVRPPRDALPDRGDAAGGAPHHPGAQPRRGAADRRSHACGRCGRSVEMRRGRVDKETYYRGVRMIPYDLLKELSIATIGILVVVLVLSVALSSPDIPSVTIQSWAKADPVDFVTTAEAELAGTSDVASYGPPYNNGTGSVQTWGFLNPQTWGGVHVPTNAANDFVLQPLTQATPGDTDLAAAMQTYSAATADQQTSVADQVRRRACQCHRRQRRQRRRWRAAITVRCRCSWTAC